MAGAALLRQTSVWMSLRASSGVTATLLKSSSQLLPFLPPLSIMHPWQETKPCCLRQQQRRHWVEELGCIILKPLLKGESDRVCQAFIIIFSPCVEVHLPPEQLEKERKEGGTEKNAVWRRSRHRSSGGKGTSPETDAVTFLGQLRDAFKIEKLIDACSSNSS